MSLKSKIQMTLAGMAICVAASAQTSEPIKVGLSGPFTGGSSPMGESMRNGVRLAVQEINSIGGIHGRPIELLERVSALGWGQRDWLERDPDYDSLRDDPRLSPVIATSDGWN